MLFYRAGTSEYLHDGVHPADVVRPSNAALRLTWMIKCFVTVVALLGLAYWLIHIAGAQYLATLTSATLLSFLLVYVVWCLSVKRRQLPQNTESIGPTEPTTEFPATSSHLTPTPLALNPALKHYGVPPRDCSPPPSYDEVLRQMGAAAAAAAATATTTTTTAVPSSSASHSAVTQTGTPNYHDVETPLLNTARQNVTPTDSAGTCISNETDTILSIPAEEHTGPPQDIDPSTAMRTPPSTTVSTLTPATTSPISTSAPTTHTASAVPETRSVAPSTTPATSPVPISVTPATAPTADSSTPVTTSFAASVTPATTPVPDSAMPTSASMTASPLVLSTDHIV